MNKPQQLTFPWSKQNKFTFDDFFFDSPNKEVKLALKNNNLLHFFYATIIFFCFLVSGFGQSKKQLQLETKRQNILKEIKEINSVYKLFESNITTQNIFDKFF